MNTTNNIQTLEANIVIIGSGGGLAAAAAAAEQGATGIVLLEKQGKTGGNTSLAGDIFACDSPVQKRANIQASRDEYFRVAMRWAHWGRVNPHVVRAYINKTGDTIHWLETKGVKFQEIGQYQMPTTHNAVGRNLKISEALRKQCSDMGVQVMLNTSGKHILRDKNGGVTGVIAVNKQGEEIRVNTKSVIIATGGFPGNEDLLKKYCPDYYEGMHLGKNPYHTGDGLLMAQEIGAAIASTIPIFHLGPVLETGYSGSLGALAYQPYMVWVNKHGRRFADESWSVHWEIGNAVLNQPDRTAFMLLDDNIRKELAARMPIFTTEFQKLQKDGSAATAESWDALAAWMGIDAGDLKVNIEEYNGYCERGYDALFAKESDNLVPLQIAPYHAVRCKVHCGETMGGIIINEKMSVLDKAHHIIAGLFACGVITDGWMGQTYCTDMFGSACSYAMNSGRIAGENAAEYVKLIIQ